MQLSAGVEVIIVVLVITLFIPFNKGFLVIKLNNMLSNILALIFKLNFADV